MKAHGFPKAEHLCLRRDVERLFAPGHAAATAWPLRVVWRLDDKPRRGPAVKVLLSVSKRRLRRAVDRNRAKRQLREAYRLHKQTVWAEVAPDACLHVAFVWLAPRQTASAEVTAAMVRLLARIAGKLAVSAGTQAAETAGESVKTPDNAAAQAGELGEAAAMAAFSAADTV